MVCPVCRRLSRSKRYLFTLLNVPRAVAQICRRLAEVVACDDRLVEEIIAACQRRVDETQRPDPNRLKELVNQRDKLTLAIDCVQRNPGESAEDQQQSDENLRRYRAERAEVSVKLAAAESASKRVIRVPTVAEVMKLLAGLSQVLLAAANGGDQCDAERVREIIRQLTCGRIEIHQMGERKQYHGWLQARFKVDIIDFVAEKLTGVDFSAGGECEVVIDLIRPEVIKFDEDAERAFARYEQKWLDVQIAKEFGCHRNKVAKLLKHAAQKRGVPLMDGRTRRKQLETKQHKPRKHELIADPVEAGLRAGLLLSEIAQQNGCDRDLVRRTAKYLNDIGRIEYKDGRSRRATLSKKTRSGKRKSGPNTPPDLNGSGG